MTFADKAVNYFLKLKRPASLPSGITTLNPYKIQKARLAVKTFYGKYFNDNNDRLFVLGINPGRFGGGITGISFTDPVALKKYCGIECELGNQHEISSKFIYYMITEFGGVKLFYSKVFISALYPLALIKDGKNFNYYDTRELAERLKTEIIKSVKLQIEFGARRDKVIVLGKKNAYYFSAINNEFNFFGKIFVLEHPRYIMQYKSKNLNQYVSKYINYLKN